MKPTLGESFLQILRPLLKIAILFLAFATLVRLIFYMQFAPQGLWPNATKDVLHAFLLGFRFDLASLCHVFSLWIVLHWILGGLARWTQSIYPFLFRAYFLFFLFILFSLLAIDIGFYSYFQDHINVLIFGFFEDDTSALIRTFWNNYPVVFILVASSLFFYGMFWYINRSTPSLNRQASALNLFVSHFILLIFTALGARGSLGLFPLGPMDTAISENLFVNELSFNGIYSMARAVELKLHYNHNTHPNRDLYGYHSKPQQSWQDFSGKTPSSPLEALKHRTPKNTWAMQTKPHVIIVMMESFGSYWLQFDNEKNHLLGALKKHSQEDYFFTRFLSPSAATVGAIGAFLINTPQRTMGPYLTESTYLQVTFDTSPALVYKKAGYFTRFIYGGNPGWRDLNKFASHQKFDSVEGEVQVEKTLSKKLEKHDWGIYDEDLYAYVQKILETAQEPQFIVILTTTNHPPYTVPSTYTAQPVEIPEAIKPSLNTSIDLAQKRFLAFQYANNAFGEFMDHIKNSNLKDQTLVGATGDHNFWLIDFEQKQVFDKWAVPFYLYVPQSARKQLAPVDTQTFGSHEDILPTLYELSLSQTDYYSFGTSLLSADQAHYALHYSSFIASRDGAVKINPQGPSEYFTWSPSYKELQNIPLPSEAHQRMEIYYRALMTSLDDFYESEKKKTLR